MLQSQKQLTTLQDLYEAAKKLNLYELYRLRTLLWDEVGNPARIRDAKNRFKEGDRVEWFNGKENKMQFAQVLDKNPKTVKLRNEDDQEIWIVYYHSLNLSKSEFELTFDSNQKLTKQHCSIGDNV
ncbi:unnamed protein product, partial [marine sediment metagenome]